MPGRKLSRDERDLGEFWDNPPAQFPRPLLRQIRIDGGPGLRGIRRLVVPLPYPLTVICGRNGVGKSTVLALAALSARAPAAWRAYWGNTRPRTQPDARAGYGFRDFFHRPRGAPAPEGLRLAWVSMDRGNEVEFVEEHAAGRWTRIGDAARQRGGGGRTPREIDFIPMGRVLPAMEFGAVRSAFDGPGAPAIEPLGATALQNLSYIMGRAYDRAETAFIRGLGLSHCRAGADYTGFDMGSGENSVIVMLSRLQAMPLGGLLVIEELELGLHAEAQVRLVEVLIRSCLERKLQIVCTTHSEVIVDALPRRARVLLRRDGEDHEAIDGVSTRFAVHEMAGRAQPELIVYTEDTFAAMLVEEALAGPQRSRVDIRDIGSNATLARQAVAHIRAEVPIRALSAFDGDCTEPAVQDWLRRERAERDIHPAWMILPGDGLAPEAWVVRELATADYRAELCRDLNCTTGAADGHIQAICVQLDTHDAGFVLAERTGMDTLAARRALVRAVARRHPALDALRRRVNELLDG